MKKMKIVNLGLSTDSYHWKCPLSGDLIVSQDGYNPSYATSFILGDASEGFDFLNDDSLALWEQTTKEYESGVHSSFKNVIFTDGNDFFSCFEIFLNKIWEKSGHKITIYQLNDPGFSDYSSWVGILKPKTKFDITQENNFWVITYKGNKVLNHKGHVLRIARKKDAQALVDDYDNNFKGDFTSNQSLLYSYLSTYYEFKKSGAEEYEIEVKLLIQWDRLYRLNPGPPLILYESKVIEDAKNFLGDYYINLPLNYAQSIEEIPKENLVPSATVRKIREIVDELSIPRKIALDIAMSYLNNFSVTMLILWLSGEITTLNLIIASETFFNGWDVKDAIEDRVKNELYNEEFDEDYLDDLNQQFKLLENLKSALEGY
jgi:hypothetical protein